MQTKQKARYVRILLLLIGLGVFFVVTYLWVRPRTLLEKAHLVAEVPDWPVPDVTTNPIRWDGSPSIARCSDLPYTWLDNSHLFAFAEATPRAPWLLPLHNPPPSVFTATGRGQKPFPANAGIEMKLPEAVHALIEMDTHSGKTVRLDALSASFGNENIYADKGLSCSPDGKYLCWREIVRVGNNFHTGWRISTLDAKTSITLKTGDFVGWTSNSRYVSLVNSRWLFNPMRCNVGVEFRKPPWSQMESSTDERDAYLDALRDNDVVITPQNHIVGLDRYGNTLNARGGSFLWVNRDLNSHDSAVGQVSVSPLQTATSQIAVKERHISPDGSHIAWVLVQNQEAALGRLYRRFKLPFRAPNDPVEQLWVTKLDGSDLCEIGLEPLPSVGSALPFAYVNWLPDGRHLSFISHHKLYTVPINTD